MLGAGGLSRVQALLLPLPRTAPPPPSEGWDCGGGVGWGWMQFQPQSWAPWLEAIFSLGPQACLHVGSQPSLPSCETTPHRPPHRPLTRTENHHTCASQRDDSGVSAVGVQERGTGTKPLQGRPTERSGLLPRLLATRCLPPGSGSHTQTAGPSSPASGSEDPRP